MTITKPDESAPLNRSSSLGEVMIRMLYQCRKFNFHHLGSAFATLPTMHEIYESFRDTDKLVLSNGHAAAALYVELERFLQRDSSELFLEMGEHPHRNESWGISCSTGSLGMGITVAVGMALAEEKSTVHCIISDGECYEGSTWEAIRFAKMRNIENLKIYVVANGWAGYDAINVDELERQLIAVNENIMVRKETNFPFEEFELRAHYFQLSEELFSEAKKKICAKFS
jgi:transketolase N-terminal domain/subunit